MDPFARLAKALRARQVRFAVIGVSGANFYARSGGTLFTTQDQDLFLPLDPENLLRAWQSCDGVGLELWAGEESRFIQGVAVCARSGPPDSLRRGRTRASVRPEAATERSKQL